MLHTFFPRDHLRYRQSCCGDELEVFGDWLKANGYSRQNIRGHLRRLRWVLERADEVGAGTVYSDRRLKELFLLQGASASRTVNYTGTRRAYRRFLIGCGRFEVKHVGGTRQHCIDEYGKFLGEARGFSVTTTAKHRSTISDFLVHALGSTRPLASLNDAHVKSFLSMKSARISRQSLQHTVAHLRSFLSFAFDRGLVPQRLDTIDTPRTYRAERPPRAMPWKLVQELLRSVDQARRAGAITRSCISWRITVCAPPRSSRLRWVPWISRHR